MEGRKGINTEHSHTRFSFKSMVLQERLLYTLKERKDGYDELYG